VAIWHLRSKVISRGKGQSAVASAAYRSGEKLRDERYDSTHDYSRKQNVDHSEIVLPEGAPERFRDRATLWNEVEATERQHNSQLAREVEVALPRELSPEDRLQLVRQFVGEQFVARGMIADFAIHTPPASDGQEAPHAHILLTMREVGPDGFGLKNRDWNSRALHEDWRRGWEETTNAMLKARGFEERIDRRSYAERGIETEPSLHEGASYSARRRARAAGLGAGPQTQRTAENEARRARNLGLLEERPELVVAELMQHHSTFTERDVARVIHRYTDDQQAFTNLKARVLAHGETVRLGEDQAGDLRYSTRAQTRTEADILAIADRLHEARGIRQIDRQTLDANLRRSQLSDEQRLGVLHLVGNERIALVSGGAGTGKTTMLKPAIEVWRAAGLNPRGVTLAAAAAGVLGKETGMQAGTVAGLLKHLEEGSDRLTSRDVVVLDEAGMLHSAHMRDLMAHVEAAGAKIVMVGDSEQIQAVEAGAPFRAMEARLGAARLVDAKRQHDLDDRKATVAMGAGHTLEGIEHYERKGAIQKIATRETMLEAASRAYLADAAELGHENTLLVAHRRKDVRDLNDQIRSELVKDGSVQRGRLYSTQNGKREFGVGDRVVFLRNQKGFHNGMTGEVIGEWVNGLRVRTGDTVREVDLTAYQHIDHAYARTLHKGQGATAQRVHVVLSGSMDRNLTYVGLSRHRESVRGYWAVGENRSRDWLVSRLTRDGRKDMTTDYAEARRLVADDLAQEAKAEREQARRTTMGRMLYAGAKVFGLDQERQRRAEAERRAREDARRAEAAQEELQFQCSRAWASVGYQWQNLAGLFDSKPVAVSIACAKSLTIASKRDHYGKHDRKALVASFEQLAQARPRSLTLEQFRTLTEIASLTVESVQTADDVERTSKALYGLWPCVIHHQKHFVAQNMMPVPAYRENAMTLEARLVATIETGPLCNVSANDLKKMSPEIQERLRKGMEKAKERRDQAWAAAAQKQSRNRGEDQGPTR
jgi:Ti-type conjugative transfer relaxase TraA